MIGKLEKYIIVPREATLRRVRGGMIIAVGNKYGGSISNPGGGCL